MTEVKIYTTPTCSYCIQAKRYFKEHDIEYSEFNVAEDQEKAQEMLQLSGQMGVPVIVVDKEVIIGFDQSALDEALA